LVFTGYGETHKNGNGHTPALVESVTFGSNLSRSLPGDMGRIISIPPSSDPGREMPSNLRRSFLHPVCNNYSGVTAEIFGDKIPISANIIE
jgi:hypothetical protein